MLLLYPTVASGGEVHKGGKIYNLCRTGCSYILQQLPIYLMKTGFYMHPISDWEEHGQDRRCPGLKSDKCLFE